MSEQKTRKKVLNLKCTLLTNIKINNKRYKIGDQIELSPEEHEIFLNAGVIEKSSVDQ